jgi:hypothetical protein
MNTVEPVSDLYEPKIPFSHYGVVYTRGVLLCLMLVAHIYLISIIGWRWFPVSIIYFSNWGFWTTNIYFVLVLMKFPDREVTKRFSHFFHTLIAMEIVITVVFWTLIYPSSGYPKEGKIIQNFAIHVIPIGCLLVEFLINKIHVCKKSFKYLVVVGLAYSLLNMTIVLITGKPIYPGLTWKDWRSVIFSLVSLILQFGGWYLIILIQNAKFQMKSVLSNEFNTLS